MKVLLLSLTVAAGAVGAPPTYTVEYIGPAMHVDGVNNAGVAIGWRMSDGVMRAWLGSPDRRMIDLPLPRGFVSSQAYDINDAGVIVGAVDRDGAFDAASAVRWVPNRNGSYTVELLGMFDGYPESAATAINESGDIVGYATFTDVRDQHAVWFNSPRGVMDLADRGLDEIPVAINDKRHVLAGQGILDLDTMRLYTLPDPTSDMRPIPPTVETSDLNNFDDVVGRAGHENRGYMNVCWTREFGWEALLPFETQFGSAYAINDLGQVVMDDGVDSVYIWDRDNGAFDLTTRIPGDSNGWTFVPNFGNDINDAGQIAAIARNRFDRQAGAVLLTPVSDCAGDFNADGNRDILDFVAFQNAFVAGSRNADCNGDRVLDVLDFVCFQRSFQAACP